MEGVYQNHRLTGVASPRISAKSPSQISVPKKRGSSWIFFMRINSRNAVFTAPEKVFSPETLIASMSNSPSNTRFVRFMCIV